MSGPYKLAGITGIIIACGIAYEGLSDKQFTIGLNLLPIIIIGFLAYICVSFREEVMSTETNIAAINVKTKREKIFFGIMNSLVIIIEENFF